MPPDLTPIQPDLRDRWQKFPKFSYNWLTVRAINLLMRLMPASKSSAQVDVSERYVEANTGRKVKLTVYKPVGAKTPLPVFLFIHGGGLVIGSPKQNHAHLVALVEQLGIAVVAVQYRLAPQAPFPAAIDDCYTALHWLHTHAGELGINPERIAIGGESAGGGLAASLAQMAHDKGQVKVVFQLLVYPMLDDRSALLKVPHNDLLTWTTKSNRFGWETYLQRPIGSADVPAYAVPARRADLTGLPPTWIGVGALDLFYDEDLAYAERLKQCGVPCELLTVEGAFHGFDVFNDPVPPVQAFRAAQVEALRKHLLTT